MSELSHKLGSAQGSAQSLEQEVGQLRAQLKQLGSEKHGLEMQLSDAKAKLLALQEKVSVRGVCLWFLGVWRGCWGYMHVLRPMLCAMCVFVTSAQPLLLMPF